MSELDLYQDDQKIVAIHGNVVGFTAVPKDDPNNFEDIQKRFGSRMSEISSESTPHP